MKQYAYDIECLSNFFSIKFVNIDNESELTTYIVTPNCNQSVDIIEFLSQPNLILASFNGHHYDDLFLNAFLTYNKPINNSRLYLISKIAIEEKDYKNYPQWFKTIKWYNKPYISIDLLKLVSVNKTRPSLKSCAIHLKYPRIQDFLVDPSRPIQKKDVGSLLDYQNDDVYMTRNLYLAIEDEINLRKMIGERYNIDVLSSGDSDITNKMLRQFYGAFPSVPPAPGKIHVRDLFPSSYCFETTELKKLDAKLKNMILSYPDYKIVLDTVKVGQTDYKIGVGGLHSDDSPRVFRTDDNYIIRDCDVTSYYVNLMLNERIKPSHLTDKFLEILKMLLDERVAGKRENDPVRRDGLKIAVLNFFGKMKFEGSDIYDPKAFFKVTIAGQILLLDLIEKLEQKGIQVISANTDGILSKIPRDLEDVYFEVCDEWQQRTNLELEYDTYKMFAQRDVNSYIALSETGKIKKKGIFVDRLKLTKRDFVYAYNAPIIPIALQSYFTADIDPRDTIENETDIHNFFFSQKTDKKFYAIIERIESGKFVSEKLQKTNRWVVSKTGSKIVKIKHKTKSRTAHMKNCYVTIGNDVNDVSLDMIDYDYYIDEVNKIITEIEGKKQLQRSLF